MTPRSIRRLPDADDPPCLRCRYYAVTWLPATPHGCRAFGFRSEYLPAMVVRRESGLRCQSFTPRPDPVTPNARPPRHDGAGERLDLLT